MDAIWKGVHNQYMCIQVHVYDMNGEAIVILPVLEHITMVIKTKQVKMGNKELDHGICSKWLKAQVGWSFIEHSALSQAV